MLRSCQYTAIPETKKQRGYAVDRRGRLRENAGIRGERGNIGIFILTHLLVAILVGFLLWSIFPPAWKDFLRDGPWGIVAAVLACGIVVVSIIRGMFHRREHQRAHDRVAKVFRETTDPEKLDWTRAANDLGVLGDPRAIAPLLAAIQNEYAFVCAEAALALGKLKATQAEKRLREMAEDDWDANARGRAKEALERIAG